MKYILSLIILISCCTLVCTQDLFDRNSFKTLEIEFYDDNWKEVLTQSWFDQDKLRLPASIRYDQSLILDSVGIRFKGNSTFSIVNNIDNPKLPFNLDFNEYYDQELLGYNKLKLANAFFDPSFIRESIAYQVYRRYLPASLSNHTALTVNGKFLGVYSQSESINKQFLKKHFDYTKGSFFKCDPKLQFGDAGEWTPPDLEWYGADSTAYQNRYELKSKYGWNDLVELIRIIEEEPQNLAEIFNIDRYLWYIAVCNALSNFDSYPGFYIHNYYLYKHENGLWQVIPWDVSESFNGALVNSISDQELNQWDLFLGEDASSEENRPLTEAILSNPLYKKQYIAHLKTVLNESMQPEDIRQEAEEVQNIISEVASMDQNAFFGFGDNFMESNLENTTNVFFFRAAGILSTLQARTNYITTRPEFNFIAPEIKMVEQDIFMPDPSSMVKISAIVENADQVDVMVSTNKYASHFKEYSMAKVTDNQYSTLLPEFENGTIVKYYIRAINADAMDVEPPRAEYEFFEFLVGQATATTEPDKLDIRIIPNPSSDIFSIQHPMTKQSEKIKIYSQLGEFLFDKDVPKFASQTWINLSNYPAGMYILKAFNSQEAFTLFKI